MILFKGKYHGLIHTQNIEMSHIRAIFFPADFYQKYRYLGSVPWNRNSEAFEALEPLIIFLDYRAKPAWCPRWFLRFLYLFGQDNSLVRVRNRTLSRLFYKITRGYGITDWKTKWTNYDLRIHVSGDQQCLNLARGIENTFYNDGKRQELAEQIRELDPNTKFTDGHLIETLKTELERLQNYIPQ
jgi:hypothetical protein